MFESLILVNSWYVVCKKGPAVFLDHTAAMDYASKHKGFVVKMAGNYVKEAPNYGNDLLQKGPALVERTEQLFEEPSHAGKGCGGCGTSTEGFSPCRDSCTD